MLIIFSKGNSRKSETRGEIMNCYWRPMIVFIIHDNHQIDVNFLKVDLRVSRCNWKWIPNLVLTRLKIVSCLDRWIYSNTISVIFVEIKFNEINIRDNLKACPYGCMHWTQCSNFEIAVFLEILNDFLPQIKWRWWTDKSSVK